MQEVAGRSPGLKKAAAELRVVADGYMTIARKVPTQEHRKGASFTQMGLSRAADAVAGKAAVPLLSLPVAPRPDGVYEGLPYVVKVLPSIRFVGGLHAPKCIDVVDSHGQVRPGPRQPLSRVVMHERDRGAALPHVSGAKMSLLAGTTPCIGLSTQLACRKILPPCRKILPPLSTPNPSGSRCTPGGARPDAAAGSATEAVPSVILNHHCTAPTAPLRGGL